MHLLSIYRRVSAFAPVSLSDWAPSRPHFNKVQTSLGLYREGGRPLGSLRRIIFTKIYPKKNLSLVIIWGSCGTPSALHSYLPRRAVNSLFVESSKTSFEDGRTRLRMNSETCLFEKNPKVVWSSALRLEKQQQHLECRQSDCLLLKHSIKNFRESNGPSIMISIS